MARDRAFEREIEDAQRRFDELASLADRLPERERAALRHAAQGFSRALDGLRAAGEELRKENVGLAETRSALETECLRYHCLFDNAPDAYLVTDEQGLITEGNAAAAALLGVPHAEMPHRPLLDYVAAADRELFLAILRRLRDSKGVEQHELRIVRRDGAMTPVSAAVVAVRDEAGALLDLRWILRDIADRRYAEEALRESEARFDLFMRYLPGAAFIKDDKGVLVYVNSAVEKAVGRPAAEIIGRTDFDFWPERVAAKMRLDEERVLKSGKMIETVDEVERGGQSLTLLTYKFLIHRAGKPPLLGAISMDITERRLATQALRESEERYRSLVELSPDAITVVVGDEIVYVNSAAVRAVGAKNASDIIGRKALDFVHPDHRATVAKRLEYVRATGKPAPLVELKFLRLDGSAVDVESSTVPIAGADPSSIQIVFHDISERKEAERTIGEYQRQLRALASEVTLSEERERRRISQILHDTIGQTLAVSKIILADAMQSPDSETHTQRLFDVERLIDESIAYSRALTLDLSAPALYVLGLDAALESLAERTEEMHGIVVRVKDDGRAKPLSEDVKVLIYQAAKELVTNAVKHAHSRHIRISVRRDNGDICLSVADDGVGFDVRAMMKRVGKGAGMGIFSIRERLSYIGGHMRIRSRPGHGTRVTLIAPLETGGRRKSDGG